MPSGVWLFNPANGVLKVLDDTFPFPNGIALSPDSTILYVTNTPHTPYGVIDSLLPRYVFHGHPTNG